LELSRAAIDARRNLKAALLFPDLEKSTPLSLYTLFVSGSLAAGAA